MTASFEDYKIHVVDALNHPGKFVVYLEEFHSVIAIVERKDQAADALRPKFETQVVRRLDQGEAVPQPGSGKAKVTLAPHDKIDALRPLVAEFWAKVFNLDIAYYFVSNESHLGDWAQQLSITRDEIVERVREVYSVDIDSIYDQPIHEVVAFIGASEFLLKRMRRRLVYWLRGR